MTLGAGTFIPYAKFALPRSYLAGIWFQFNAGSSVVWSGGHAAITDVGGVVTAGVTLYANAFPWNSNFYTLDYWIIESWYKVAPSPTEIPLPFALTYYRDPDDDFPYLLYQPFSVVGTGNYKFLLPGAPSDYWGPNYNP